LKNYNIARRVYGVLVSEANLPPLPNYAWEHHDDNMDGFGRMPTLTKVDVIPSTSSFFWSIVRPSHISTVTTGMATPF